MKDIFPMHYDYTTDEYNEIWSNGIFIVDANVLLNLYRYTEKTRKQLLKIFEEVQDRLWIPHQVGLEYYSNRTGVILEQIDAFDKLIKSLKDSSHSVETLLNDGLQKFKKRHPSIDLNSINTGISQYFEELTEQIKKEKQNHPNLLEDDQVLETISKLFDGKVGLHYDQETLNKLFEEGAERYDKEFPPGYKDKSSKEGLVKYYKDIVIKSEYGDLIVWKQIMDKAIERKLPVIFITDDVKEDWWERVKGRTIGPRKELINEFIFKTNQKIIMYSTERFMEYSSDFLKNRVEEKAIAEVQNLYQVINDEELLETDIKSNIIKKATWISDELERRKGYEESLDDMLMFTVREQLESDDDVHEGDSYLSPRLFSIVYQELKKEHTGKMYTTRHILRLICHLILKREANTTQTLSIEGEATKILKHLVRHGAVKTHYYDNDMFYTIL